MATVVFQAPSGMKSLGNKEYTANNFVYNFSLIVNSDTNISADTLTIYKNDDFSKPFKTLTKVDSNNSKVWKFTETNKLTCGNYKYTIEYKESKAGASVTDSIFIRITDNEGYPLPVVNGAFIYGLCEINSNLKISADITVTQGFIDSVALYRRKSYLGDWVFIGYLNKTINNNYEFIDVITDNIKEPTDYFYKIVALSSSNTESSLVIGTVINPSDWVENDLNIQRFINTNPPTFGIFGGGSGEVSNDLDWFYNQVANLQVIYNYQQRHDNDFLRYTVDNYNDDIIDFIADINSLQASISGTFKASPTSANPNIMIITGTGSFVRKYNFEQDQTDIARFTLTIWDTGIDSNTDKYRMVINCDNKINLDHDSGVIISDRVSTGKNLDMKLTVIVPKTSQTISKVEVRESPVLSTDLSPVRGGFLLGDSSINLWNQSNGFNIYNNLAIPATLVVLSGSTFYGQKIYRLTMTPNTQAHIDSLKINLWNHGVYGSSMTYTAGTRYSSSVFWRAVNKTDIVVGGGASNISPGWGTTTTTDIGGGWKRSDIPWYNATTNKTDNKFWSFKCPSARLNEAIIIDFTCPQIISGRSTPVPCIEGTTIIGQANLSNQMSLSNINNTETYYCNYTDQGIPFTVNFKNVLIRVIY